MEHDPCLEVGQVRGHVESSGFDHCGVDAGPVINGHDFNGIRDVIVIASGLHDRSVARIYHRRTRNGRNFGPFWQEFTDGLAGVEGRVYVPIPGALGP